MTLPQLAKSAVETYIEEWKVISPPQDLTERFLKQRAGVFVTILKEGELRGCIGTHLPTKENIAKEVIYNAISAATEDYRFPPVQKPELSYLSYTVSILGNPELVKNNSELDPKKFGIIVKTSPLVASGERNVVFDGHLLSKSGLLLPDLEGVDTPEKQISLACQKGGIDPLKEKIIIFKFTVEKYE